MMHEGKTDSERRQLAILQAAFARLDPVALAAAAGGLLSLVLAGATAVLLMRGAPPGIQIGSHLQLLSYFLPGYSVTWGGAFVGLIYGFLIGAALGFLMAMLWNITHHAYAMAVALRASFDRNLD